MVKTAKRFFQLNNYKNSCATKNIVVSLFYQIKNHAKAN